MAGMSLQPTSPKSHSSEKYREASTGTQVTSRSRSPAARLEMKMFGTLLMALLEMKIFMRVMLPSKPTVMMSRYSEGITHRTMNMAVPRPEGSKAVSGTSWGLPFPPTGTAVSSGGRSVSILQLRAD